LLISFIGKNEPHLQSSEKEVEITASIKSIETEGKNEPQKKPPVTVSLEKEKLENTASIEAIEVKGKY